MRVPSLTPAGILTVYRLVRRSRPEPLQRGQGSSITVPLPRQRGQGCESAKNPWLSATTPRPLHSGQIFGAVPGFAPEPWHSEHAVSSVTGIFVSTPLSESSKERLISTSTSLPLRPRVRPPPARPPRPPNKPPKSSPRSPTSPTLKAPKLTLPPWKPPRPFHEPKVPYLWRCSGSHSRS